MKRLALIAVLCSLYGFAFSANPPLKTISLVCQPEIIKSTSGENVDVSESLPTVFKISYYPFPTDFTGKMAIISQTGDYSMDYTGRIRASEITGSNKSSWTRSYLGEGLWSIYVNRDTGQYRQEMENVRNNKNASIFGKCNQQKRK